MRARADMRFTLIVAGLLGLLLPIDSHAASGTQTIVNDAVGSGSSANNSEFCRTNSVRLKEQLGRGYGPDIGPDAKLLMAQLISAFYFCDAAGFITPADSYAYTKELFGYITKTTGSGNYSRTTKAAALSDLGVGAVPVVQITDPSTLVLSGK